MTNVAIIYYSTYGHIATLAESVKAGVESVPGVTATVYQVAETLSEEILSKMHAPPKKDYPVATEEADAILFGLPTRFGSLPAQVKTLLDSCGALPCIALVRVHELLIKATEPMARRHLMLPCHVTLEWRIG